MPHATTIEERKAAIEASDGPEREQAQKELRNYLQRSQLTIEQFAAMIGIARSTLEHFRRGTYHHVGRSDLRLRRKLRIFFDTNPIGEDGALAAGKLYDTENVQTLRHWFHHCLGVGKRRGRMACVYAGPGSQKTFVSEHLVAELNREYLRAEERPRAFHVYCSQDERPLSLVRKCLKAAGLTPSSTIQPCLATLRFHLRRQRVLFIFDEAQHLSIPSLEIVRELNDLPPYIGVMLLGSHRLRQFFDQRAAEMEQWHSRVTAAIELPGIERETIAGIVRAELGELIDFATPKGQRKLDTLLQSCLVRDIFSREDNKQYFNVRTVFNTIEQIREEAAARKGVIQ